MIRRPLVLRSATTALLAAAASSFTFLGWSGLAVDPSGFIRPLVLLALGVAVAGVVLRSAGAPRPAVVVVQVVGVLVTLHAMWSAGTATWGLLPNGTSLGEVGATLTGSVDASREWAAPVPARVTTFDPLMIAVGSIVVLLVDAYAVTYRRAALAGLPLLAAFTLPAAVTGGMRWDNFLLAGAAFLMLMAAEQLHAIGRWGRPLVALTGHEPTGHPEHNPHPPSTARMLARNRGSLARVLAPSLLLAVVASLLVPADAGLLNGGPGGAGSAEVSIDNPITDLRRDLVQGPDVNLLTLYTDDPDPSYLRISALDSFDGDTWRPSQRELPASQRIDGPLPDPVGLDPRVQQTRYRYRILAFDDLDSEWLPLPFPAIAAYAPGDWRYDEDSLDVTTTDEDLNTSGLAWEATGLRVSPTARQLLEAPSAPASISKANTELPFGDEVPQWLDSLVDEVVGDADTDYARAVAMQRWFRDPDIFTYSLERSAGNGLDDLRSFLTEGEDGRVGYCEQFASAMAIMARVTGIPSRVAVGFLRPDALSVNTWLYSARDLHSWPELYFSGVGWVRFEPTPADRAPTVPRYTAGQLPELDEESAAPTASASAPTPTRSLRAEDPLATPEEAPEAGGTSWRWLSLVAPPLVLLLLLITPRLLRRRLTSLRMSASLAGGGRGAEAAWDEVRAAVLDLGQGWSDRATLEGQQQALLRLVQRAPVGARAAGAPAPVTVDDVRAAVGTLVRTLERARFSPVPVPDHTGRTAWASAQVVVRALWDRTEPADRRRATWWPRSLRVGAAPEDVSVAGMPEATEDQAREAMVDNVRV